MSDQTTVKWQLQLICCSYDDGIKVFDSWEDADEFRKMYCDEGAWKRHERTAILTEWQEVDDD